MAVHCDHLMSVFGRFLELSVPCSDVLRSLAFYRDLGFRELATGDVRSWHYAVVSDGALAIGLHGDGFEEPTLSFVRPHLARQVDALLATGHQFEFIRLGDEEFHEAALRSPDGQLIRMMEARTFSPGGSNDGEPLPGRCREVQLGCHEMGVTRRFLETAGFLPLDGEHDDEVRLQVPGLTLALQARKPSAPALGFRLPGGSRLAARLEAMGIDVRRSPQGYLVSAPEGTRLIIG